MEALRELFLVLGLDADEAAFATGEAAVHGLEKALELAYEAAEKLADFLIEAVESTAEYAGEMKDTADALGVTTDQFQELAWAGAQSGLKLGDLVSGMTLLTRAMYSAKTGGAEASTTFSQLGVSVTDSSGRMRGTEDVLKDLAKAFAQMPAGPERAAIAMEVFGKSGRKMVPLLLEGEDGLKAFADAAHRAGVVMSEEDLEAAKAFGDDMESLSTSLSGVTHEIGAGLIKAIDPLLRDFQKWFEANRKIISQKVEQVVVRPLTWAITKLGVAARVLGKTIEWLAAKTELLTAVLKTAAIAVGSYFAVALVAANGGLVALLVNTTLNTIAYGMLGWAAVRAGLAAAGAWVAATWPIMAATVAVVLLITAVEDLWGAFTGKDSLTGEAWKVLMESIRAAKKTFDEWVNAWSPDDNPIVRALRLMNFLLSVELPGAIGVIKSLMANIFAGTPLGSLVMLASRLGTMPGIADVVSPASASPQGTVAAQLAAAAGVGGGVLAPQFQASFTINTHPGQSAQEIATETSKQLDDWWNEKLSAAAPFVR